MNKDVLLTIYEIVHHDLTKRLNAEYLCRLKICDNIYCYYISIKYNRPGTLPKTYNNKLPYYRLDIYTRYGKRRCDVSKNY